MDDQKPESQNPTPPNQAPSNPPQNNTEFVTSHEAQVSTNPTTPVSTEPSVSAPPQTAVVSDSKPKKSKVGLFVFLLVVLLIGAAAAYYFLVYNKPKTSSSVTVIKTTKKDIPSLKVTSFNPLPHDYYPNIVNDSFQVDINMQMFEPLVEFENGTQLKPALAESWTNPDPTTWVFKLKKNVKFHTGKTMTANDVKASIEAIQPTDYGKVYTSTIKTVTAVDDNTVKIVTSAPDPILTNELTGVFIFDTTSTKKNDPINGSGPYTLKSDTKDAITLSAFDGYHGGHVYTREVSYMGYNDSSEITDTMLKNHDIGYFVPYSDPDFLKKLKDNGYSVSVGPSYTTYILALNTLKTDSPLSKLAVRKALALAVDPNAIKVAAKKVDATVASQVVAKGIPGYNPTMSPVKTDVDAAKKALTAAGYPNGFTVTLTYFASAQAAAETLQKQFAAVGVTVKHDPETDQDKLGEIAIGGKTDMFPISLSSSYVDASDVLSFFIDTPNYNSPALNKLNDEPAKEMDAKKRIAIMQEMSKFVVTDQAAIPLYDTNSFYTAPLDNLVMKRDTISTAIGTYYWQAYAK